MAKFIRAADAIRAAFGCAVIIVHHCGVQGTRPRGHTSLTGADDAQIAVERAEDGIIIATVEHMKDGPDGGAILCRLEQVELGADDDGDPKTSCIIVPVEGESAAKKPAKLSDSDLLALDALRQAMGEHAVSPIPQSGTNWVCPVEVWRELFLRRQRRSTGTRRKKLSARARAAAIASELSHLGGLRMDNGTRDMAGHLRDMSRRMERDATGGHS